MHFSFWDVDVLVLQELVTKVDLIRGPDVHVCVVNKQCRRRQGAPGTKVRTNRRTHKLHIYST